MEDPMKQPMEMLSAMKASQEEMKANMATAIKNEAKYLGVWLDGSLCYRLHILEAGKKAEKITNALVKLMPNDDTPEHTLFRCPAWLGEKDRVEIRLRRVLHIDNIVEVMLEGEEKWNVIAEEQIMRKKEEEEWRR
ncbi:hypothetical protein NQ315_003777 [Exocentrus adspersus]|uniref:Tudor domain-containing protein n=1 Tax=Exocentrus adspersus TaxID=1586481 RepID=A0AAV8V594_9CUCU|nr:hypothetical protein NQ315_003777 [Exocentrus adspersus]